MVGCLGGVERLEAMVVEGPGKGMKKMRHRLIMDGLARVGRMGGGGLRDRVFLL